MGERLGAEDVRSRLVAAMVDLLRQRGVADISVRDVAAAAGVNHGLVHRHFGSKAALVEAAVAHLSAEIHRGSPERPGMAASTFAYLRAHPEIPAMVARACLDGPPELLARAAPTPERLEEIVAPVRDALACMGVTADPHVLNALASAALLGWFLYRPLLARGFGLPADADDQIAALAERLDQLLATAVRR